MAILSQSGAAAADHAPPRPSRWTLLWNFMAQNPLGAAGAVIVIVMIVMAAFAEAVTVYDPTANNFGEMLERPSAEHWLGTDQFGRDLYTRIVYGARTALLVGFVSALIGGTLGLVLGVASAYFGGRFDFFLQSVMDVLMAFPLIILAVAVFPGIAISLAVFGFNLFGDALRDWLDPKMKI